jgi:hypothetical protein
MLYAICHTEAHGVENRPSAKMRGTPKSLCLENHTKSQWNARNSSKVPYVIKKEADLTLAKVL